MNDSTLPISAGAAAPLPPALARRLRAVWRSAGWPCRDPVEAELIARGLLEATRDPQGRETVGVTVAGVAAMAAATARHRQARGPHEALVDRVARHLQREGRIVWRGLSLRAGLADEAGPATAMPLAQAQARVLAAAPGPTAEDLLGPVDGPADRARLGWVIARPDLFSLRPSTQEDGLLPLAHEIKAHRSDLLADLRRPDKARAYRALAGACWYVLREGIGDADDVPPPFGVMRERGDVLEVLRPPERHPVRLGLATWLALARATPQGPAEEADQGALRPT